MLMFLMNNSIDKRVNEWDEMFLPGELARFVKQLSYQDSVGVTQELVKTSSMYYYSGREHPRILERPPGTVSTSTVACL